MECEEYEEYILNFKHQYPERYYQCLKELKEIHKDKEIMREWYELQLNLDHQVRNKC